MERPSATSSEWLRKRVTTLYPSVLSTMGTATPNAQGAGSGTNNALAIIAQALAAGNTTQTQNQNITTTPVTSSGNYDKFGMSDGNVDRMCVMCGLKPGQGAGLPSWFSKLNEKGTSKDGQRTLLRKLFADNLKYEEQPIPCTPVVLDMVMNKFFTGDCNYQTTTGVMNGLSPFLFAPQSAEEIADATSYAEAVATSTSTTVDKLQKLSKKAKAPQTVAALINLLKTFGNVLEKLFSPGCPLLIHLLKDAIIPLVQLSPIERQVYSQESIAAIAWAVYHQAMFFAQGDMVGKTPLTNEWVQMTNTVKGGGRSLENYSIPIALANRAPPPCHHSPNERRRNMKKMRIRTPEDKEKEDVRNSEREKPRTKRMKELHNREVAKRQWISIKLSKPR